MLFLLKGALRQLRSAEAKKSRDQVIGAGAQATALVGGVIVGGRMAKKADARFAQSITKNEPLVKQLAADASRSLNKISSGEGTAVDKARLKAIHAEGRHLMQRGPLSAGKIAGFAIATALTRSLASGVDDPTAKAALNTVATLEASLAIGLAGQTYMNRQNPTVAMPASARATIKAAGIVANAKEAPTPKPRRRKTVGKKAPAAPPAASSVDDAVKAAQKSLSTLAKVARGTARALPFATPAFIGVTLASGMSEARAAVRKGDDRALARAGVNTVAGVANTLSFGLTGLATTGLMAARDALRSPAGKIDGASRAKARHGRRVSGGSAGAARTAMAAAHQAKAATRRAARRGSGRNAASFLGKRGFANPRIQAAAQRGRQLSRGRR